MSIVISRHSNHPTGNQPNQLLLACEETGVRPAIPEWNAQALRCADCNVSSELSWWTEKCQRKKIRCDTDESLKEKK